MIQGIFSFVPLGESKWLFAHAIISSEIGETYKFLLLSYRKQIKFVEVVSLAVPLPCRSESLALGDCAYIQTLRTSQNERVATTFRLIRLNFLLLTYILKFNLSLDCILPLRFQGTYPCQIPNERMIDKRKQSSALD
jgi:hypothetical protein